jgi:predicted regulator of Ras-like GTPase activity (Roadblock/LC7/MglB family)
MDVAQALADLAELSSQIGPAVILDAEGTLLGSTAEADRADELARAAQDLLAAAGELHSGPDEVTRVEVELAEGALFVLREGGRTIAATTGPRPTAGLVAYDLRTCLQGADEPPRQKRRAGGRKPKDEDVRTT